MLKKILLSIGLIGLFTFYAVYQRSQINGQTPISLNNQDVNTPTPSPTAGNTAAVPGTRSGQLVNINGTIFLVGNSGLYGFPNMRVFNSWGYSLSSVAAANSAEDALVLAAVVPSKTAGCSSPVDQINGNCSSVASASPTPTVVPTQAGKFKNGSYTGPVTDALYGKVQVQATVQGGKLASIQMLQEPNDRGNTSEIAARAFPKLISEAISAQSSNVDIVSGATQDSEAFNQSLTAALSQAS